nr:hypothetical protein OG409_36045 [Streptomyces sp. NBC_00974]
MRFGTTGAVFAGVPAGLYLAARILWEGRSGPWAIPLFAGVVLLQWVGVGVSAKRVGAGLAVVVLVLNGSWMLLVLLRSDMREGRTMHDRGVTEQAVVTEWIRTSDPFAGVDNKVTVIVVRLPAGDIARLELNGARAPEVGGAVQVTRDPGGRFPIRLGGRPGAPGGVLAMITLIVMIGSGLGAAAAWASIANDSLS